jgi:hypothetical protein
MGKYRDQFGASSNVQLKGFCIDENFERKIIYNFGSNGPDTPDVIRQRDAILRFLLTDNLDPTLKFSKYLDAL